MSEKEEICIAEVTAEGHKNKPITISKATARLSDLIKEGKNKFRKKYKFVVYCHHGGDQFVNTDEDLRRVLELQQDGNRLRFRLTNAAPNEQDAGPLTIEQSSGFVFIIGNEEDMEDDAIGQLKHAGRLEGCVFAIGMPDLHAGKGIPIGATIMTRGVAYPQLVDNDIGCGMSFVQTPMDGGRLNSNKLQKMAVRLSSIDGPYYASREDAIEACSKHLRWGSRTLEPLPELRPSHHYEKLGTVGGGNHFAELQEFHEVFDAEACAKFGIDTNKLHLLVHSGSRSLGSQYVGEFCEEASKTMKHGPFPAETNSDLFQEYLGNHDVAINFAVRNRHLIAKRLLEQLTPGGIAHMDCKVDIIHNFLEKVEMDSNTMYAMKSMSQDLFPKTIPVIKPGEEAAEEKTIGWIHRKGATPTTQSRILVIPGSKGSLSYLVEINEWAQHGSAYSLAHGAGRKVARSKALARHRAQYPNPQRLLRTGLGGVVVCEKKDLVYEEAPALYKDIDRVVNCLTKLRLDSYSKHYEEDPDEGTQGLVAYLQLCAPSFPTSTRTSIAEVVCWLSFSKR